MPATTEKQLNFMRVVQAVKAGKIPRDKAGKAAVAAADGMTRQQVRDFTVLKKADGGLDDYDGSGVRNRWDTTPEARRLTSPDKSLIEHEKSKWMPAILESPGDPVAVRLASPGKQALLGALLAGGGAAGAGYAGARLLGADTGSAAGSAATLGLLAAVAGAVLVGLGRREQNEQIEDGISRLPKGRATIRDYDENPLLNSEPETVARLAALNAAYRGRPLPKEFMQGAN